MPASIPYASQQPKFPDGKRRPGIIHLAKPLSTPPRTTVKLPGLNPSHKQSQMSPMNPSIKVPGLIAVSQLRTPSPSPRRTPGQNRRRQKRSSVGNINGIIVVPTSDNKIPLTPPLGRNDAAPADVAQPLKQSIVLLSPPPTPAARKSQKKAKPAPPVLDRTAAKGRRSNALASPPTTPGVNGYKFAPVEEAVFPLLEGIEPLLPPVTIVQSTAQSSDDSLPLADDDEVIVWKQPAVASLPPVNAKPVSPLRTPSPTLNNVFANWDDVKNLPRLSPATVARLKEEYDIKPSKGFQRAQTMTQEPDSLTALLLGSNSAPATPGHNVFSTSPVPMSYMSSPIPIKRPVRHIRAPSVPMFPTNGRVAEYRADVADIFGLDIRDKNAVDKATEAWKAYAGSAFNVSPPDGERAVAPKPKFLGRLFV